MFDWNIVEENDELVRFSKSLITFRLSQPTVRRKSFFSGQQSDDGLSDVNWYSGVGTAIDWLGDDSTMICLLTAPGTDEDPDGLGRDVLMLINATGNPRDFILPPVAKSTRWRLVIDTAADSPMDAYPDGSGPALPASSRITLLNHTFRCYVASGSYQPNLAPLRIKIS